jgi:hypothetical protein
MGLTLSALAAPQPEASACESSAAFARQLPFRETLRVGVLDDPRHGKTKQKRASVDERR